MILIKFIPTDCYTEVTLKEGLSALETGRTDKLFSDGLEDYEYIYFNKENGFCYEDNCVIGSILERAFDRLLSVGWCYKYKFFIKKN